MFLTASFFSLIHQNAFAFLPVFILGMGLGYLYEKRGTLVPSIMLHVVHNTVFIGYFFLRRDWTLLSRTLVCFCAGLFLGSWLLVPHHPWLLIREWIQALFHSGFSPYSRDQIIRSPTSSTSHPLPGSGAGTGRMRPAGHVVNGEREAQGHFSRAVNRAIVIAKALRKGLRQR